MHDSIMLDIETLSTRPDAVILSIGAAKFNEKTFEVSDTFYQNVCAKDGKSLGLHVCPETLNWWKGNVDAFKQTQVNTVSVAEALTKFNAWVGNSEVFWANGMNFDFPIMEWSYRVTDLKYPWKYFNCRDARTVYKIAKLDMRTIEREGTYHNAVDDCVTQIKGLQKIFG